MQKLGGKGEGRKVLTKTIYEQDLESVSQVRVGIP